jgi:hypothetical protein
MPLETRPEIHVGDIGTRYQVRIYDETMPFDPTTAMLKDLIFSLPLGVVLTKPATVVPEGSPAASWLLVYQVTAGAGAGSPPDEFHAAPGVLKIQARLEWADGSIFHSDIRTTDEDGVELRIYKNID